MTRFGCLTRWNGGVLALAAFLVIVPLQAQKKEKGVVAGDSGGAKAQDRITREVRHELVMLPYYGVFDNLVYRVDGGNVTLMGQVARPTLKSDAGNVVKGIEGVTHVDNQIEVLPLSPMDDGLRVAEYRAIYGHPGLDRYAMQAVPPIHIIVSNGKVALEGVVATQADKDLAAIRANTVSGVFSVVNNLRAESQK
jgi:hyperosmotically inducible protein